jgi:hypothetical protein
MGPSWCFRASLSRLLPVLEINKEFSEFFNDPKRERLKGWQSFALNRFPDFGSPRVNFGLCWLRNDRRLRIYLRSEKRISGGDNVDQARKIEIQHRHCDNWRRRARRDRRYMASLVGSYYRQPGLFWARRLACGRIGGLAELRPRTFGPDCKIDGSRASFR